MVLNYIRLTCSKKISRRDKNRARRLVKTPRGPLGWPSGLIERPVGLLEWGAIIALVKSKIDNWTPPSYQKRLSAVKKGREGYHGRLVRAEDIKKGCRLSKQAVGCQKKAVGRQKRLWRLPWTSSMCPGHLKRPSVVKKVREPSKRPWRLPWTSSTCRRRQTWSSRKPRRPPGAFQAFFS